MQPSTSDDNDVTMPRPIVSPPIPTDAAQPASNAMPAVLTHGMRDAATRPAGRPSFALVTVALLVVFAAIGIIVKQNHGRSLGTSFAQTAVTPTSSVTAAPVVSATSTNAVVPTKTAQSTIATPPTLAATPTVGQYQAPAPTQVPQKVYVIFDGSSISVGHSETITASTSGTGDVMAYVANVTVTEASSPINAFGDTSLNYTYIAVPVINPTNTAIVSPINLSLHSQPDGNTCTTLETISVPANGSVYQLCKIMNWNPHPMNWNDVTTFPPLEYTGPIENALTPTPYWVPPGCGGPDRSLNGDFETPIAVAVGRPVSDIDPLNFVAQYGQLQCSPASGTIESQPFTFTQTRITTATITWASSADMTRILVNTCKTLTPPNYVYVNTNTLGPWNPIPGTTSPTGAQIFLAGNATYTWNWDKNALNQLAQKLAGKDEQTALNILYSTPGIYTASNTPAYIQAANPYTYNKMMPTNPADIIFQVSAQQLP